MDEDTNRHDPHFKWPACEHGWGTPGMHTPIVLKIGMVLVGALGVAGFMVWWFT